MNATIPKVRTFIAIELPDQTRSDIAGVQKDLASAGLKLRWVKPQNIHLTLTFLGDVDRHLITAICDSMNTVTRQHPSFELQPRGLGCFPGLKNPRVFWVGLSGALVVLKALQTDVENALTPLGFNPEKRPFRGHVTIGRIKNRLNSRKLADVLRSHSEFSSDIFTVQQVTLFGSELQPTGPVYTRLCAAPLESS